MHKLDKGVFAEYKSDILDKEKTSKGAWTVSYTHLDVYKRQGKPILNIPADVLDHASAILEEAQALEEKWNRLMKL